MRSSQSERVLEGGCFLLTLLLWLFILSPLLYGETTFPHDSFNWTLPLFHHFATELLQWRLPLWNPFEHGGEPFYPLIIAFRFHDPVMLLTLFVGRVFTQDTIVLFNWSRVLQVLCYVLGTYFLLRRLSERVWVKCAVIPILFFSSFSLSSFVQDGMLNQFQWAPWAILSFLKISDGCENSRSWWGLLILSLGLHLQSYHGVGLVCAIVLLSVCRPQFLFAMGLKSTLKAAVVLMLLLSPSLLLLAEGDLFIYPMRELPVGYQEFLRKTPGNVVTEPGGKSHSIGLVMNYDEVTYTGTFQKWSNVVQALSPNANYLIHRNQNEKTWGRPSEAFIYLGIIPWVLALFGLLWSRHADRWVWRGFAVVFGLLCLGPVAGLHTLLFPVFPPLWILRHLEFLSLFSQLGLLAGVVYGLDISCGLGAGRIAFRMSPLRVSLLIFASTLSIFLLSGWDVAGVREAIYPVLCLSLLPTILLTVLFRRVITRWDVLLSFLAAQALLLIIFSNERGFALLWCLVMGVIPLLIYLTFRTRWSVLLLGVCVTFDLFFAFHQSNLLYSGVAAPRTRVAKEVAVPFSRAVAPNTPPASERSLFPQYVSLYERKRYAFSAPFRYTEAESKRNSLGETRRTMRWHSYLLLRSYFNYVNSNVSDAQMERDFGLDGPLLRLVRARDGVGVKGQIRVEEVSSGRLVVDVKVSESAALYFSDSHDPYWRARVNDIAQPVFKVGGQFKAVKLDVGSHRVVFSYEPFLFYWGMLFYFSGIVSLLANTALPHFFNSVQGRRQYIGFPAPA